MRAAQVRDGVGEVVDRDRLDSRERHLPAGLGCTHEPGHLRAARAFCRDQRTGHRPNATVEGKLAERCDTLERARRQLVRGREDGERDGEVEA